MNVGDRVKLISDRYGDSEENPIWGRSQGEIKGIIVSINTYRDCIFVQWDNGACNDYTEKDLGLVEILPYSRIKVV